MVRQGALMFVLSGCVNKWHGEKTTIVRARRPINAAVVGCIEVSYGAFRWVSACRVPVEHGNHTRAGTVPDRRGRCGMNRGSVAHVSSGRGMLRPGMVCNHARAGTGLDQRQRRGMSRQGWFGLAQARLVTVWKTTTRLARFRLRRRMVGCIAASLASVRFDVFGRCMARCGLVNHRRGRHESGFEAARWS